MPNEPTMTTPIDLAEAMRKVTACEGVDIATVHAAGEALERIIIWFASSSCYCPCCQSDRQCADDCTYADDDPTEAELMAHHRSVIWGEP